MSVKISFDPEVKTTDGEALVAVREVEALVGWGVTKNVVVRSGTVMVAVFEWGTLPCDTLEAKVLSGHSSEARPKATATLGYQLLSKGRGLRTARPDLRAVSAHHTWIQ